MTTNSINNTSSSLTVSNLSLTSSTISTISTNSNLILAPNGTGSVVVPGISFDSGTNIFSGYKEKTAFTPTISSLSGSGITYTTNEGFYSVIGNQILFSVNFVINSLGTSTGTIYISLPPSPYNNIASASDYTYCFTENVRWGTFFGTGIYCMACLSGNDLTPPNGTFTIQGITETNNVNNLEAADLQTGSVIRASGIYLYE